MLGVEIIHKIWIS